MSPSTVTASACSFPKLLETGAEQAEMSLSLEIELSSLNALEDVLGKDKAHFERILRACWELVLRCYTGLDTVSFVYEDETSLNKSGLLAYVMHIDASGTCANMLSREEAALAIDLKDAWKNMNSAMLIQRVSGVGDGEKSTRTMVSPECCVRLHVQLQQRSFRIFLDHWDGMISSSYGRSIAATFDTVMSQILLQSNRRIDGLHYLSTHDKAQIMKWNGTKRERVKHTIHETIMDQVARVPDAEAVHAWDGSMTFASLDRASSDLALRLRDMGVGPEVFVPLAFSKSRWNVVAMLGVLKAGGAFMPLDPTHPIARLKSLTQAVNAKVMLCSYEYAHALSSVSEAVLPLDEQMLSGTRNYGRQDVMQVSPDNAAYIIFTSGSTGIPKGTVIEHASFCSGARYHAPALHLSGTNDLRALAFSSHSFDASLIDMLTVLMVGGCVCIPDEHNRLNNLAGVINDMRVNWATLTPTVVRFLEPIMVPRLETIVLAGEAMSQSNLDTWSRINLVNAYGPSECSVAACINSHVDADSDPKDIGLPVGIRAWVVDPENYNNLLPFGCVGELLAEGPTLARCYLNDSEKTAHVFVHDPEWAVDAYGNQWKLRGYLTGDLVRQYPDGSLRFIGRKDTQIKYHGQRIELGEIENSIRKESSIKHVLVTLPRSGYFQGRLVATVSMAGFKVISPPAKLALLTGQDKHVADVIIDKVRESLESQIPAYMIPSTWVIVEEIPQLVSGKLDRKVTSAWVANLDERSYQLANPSSSEAVQAVALTDAEQKIREITCHVLNLGESQVSLDRSFLGSGGDSISAMQMMSICQKDGIGITVQVIMKSKSLRKLAASIQEVHIQSYQEEKIGEHFDLSPIQRLWFQLPNQGKGHFNQSFFLQVTRPVSENNTRQAIESIIARHSMLRARFDDIGYGVWQQRVTNDISGSYRFRRHTINEKADATTAVAECQQSLNPFKGPLFGVEVFDLNDGKQLMFAVGHHLVIDLVSWRTILQDLEDLLEDPHAKLLPTTMPFSAWCRLQAEQAPTLRLNEVLPHTNVPTGNFAYWNVPDNENTYGNATSERFELGSAVTAQFLSVAQDNRGVDPIDVLLATLIFSWARVFKDREVPPIYNEGHGREPWESSTDLSRTVGWFTTVFPIHVAVSESDNLLDVIKHVNAYRKQVPDNGRPYFARRCLTSVGQEFFGTHTRWEMSFNYLGQYQQLEREGALLSSVDTLAGEARGAGGIADVGFDAPRFGLFEISAVIVQKKLRFSFTFNKHMRHQERIREWISASEISLVAAIESLSQHCPDYETNNFSSLGLTVEHREKCLNEILPRFGLSVVDLEDAYPCAGIQDGMLLGRSRDSGYYSAAVSYEARCLSGSTDAQRLANAWQLVVCHHSALRTIFVESFSKADAMYDQLVLKNHEAKIVRLCSDSSDDAMQLLESRRSDDFDDRRTPPHRFTIVETKSHAVFCMLEISHAIMDGESIDVLFRDLAKAYDQRLNQPTASFSAYVQHLRKMDLVPGVQFWRNYLREVESTCFPSLKDFNHDIRRELRCIRFESDSINPQVMQDFCLESGVTMANVFHTAWAMTLSYYVGSEDVCFGYLTSGRNAPIEGIDSMVGPLINTLICRVKLQKYQTLRDILGHVQQDYMDSFEHRLVPLSLVQNAAELHGSALFNSVLSYRRVKFNKRIPQDGDLAFVENGPYYDPTEYPIGINIEVSDDAVALSLECWTDYISDAHAQNITSTFTHCLQNIVQHSSKVLGDVTRASPEHIQQILEWNKIPPEIVDDCLHNVFSKQVRSQPNAPAICSYDGNFTYNELDSYSDRLAQYLLGLGIGPDVYVPCCFDKSSFAVVAMMAVLKAGGACVALDANHPKQALKTKVLDTKASVLLTTTRRAELFEDYVPNVVCVTKGLFNQIPICTKPAISSVRPEHPAFVIFTSGSTGNPKGVVLEHRSIVSSMFAHGPKLDIQPGTRFLQFASYPFDVSLEEIFTTLILGGCCCIPSEEQRLSNIVGAINELDVNFVDLTPTVASMINPNTVPSVKVMAMGGEPLSKAVIEKWCGRVRLHGFYGPSEASISCTWKEFTNDTETEPNNIGQAIGSHAWIVHPEDVNMLQPIGCKGELLIEGPILARGYLGDPQKTEKSFICNPSWACGSGGSIRRFYRTGDMVSYGSNGDVKYHGRIDTQVKLNGQRIELGEIEYHMQLILSRESRSAVELVTVDGKRALAAFIEFQPAGSTAKAEASPLLDMTQSFKELVKTIEVSISGSLPSYYLPKLFFPMAKLPMTTSGKLDRRSLRNLVSDLPHSQTTEYRLSENGGDPPATLAELELAGLWESILSLKIGTVGRESGFFQLGGDSATAMRLSMLARERGISLSVSAIFQHPTLSQMATGSAPSSLANDESKVPIPFLEPFSLIPKNMRNRISKRIAKECEMDHSLIEDVYPCTKLQEGLIALSMQEPGAYVAQTVYKIPAGIDVEEFRQAWNVVFETETILRTRIVYTEEYGFLQAVLRQAIEWRFLENLESLNEASRHLPNRQGGTLCTFTIAGEKTSPHFIWTAHHSIYDGWSISLLLSRVESALKTNQTQPEKTVQYRHFINYLADIDSEASDSFWMSRLSDVDAPIFPVLPRPGYQATASSSATRRVVANLPPQFHVTMASVIQSAWAALLSSYTSSAQVIFGLTLNGRDAEVAGIEDMLGPTIATIPVLLDINREWTVGKFLSEVQSLSAERMLYQHAGLQHIRQLNDETAAACSFQNMLMITSESSSDTDSTMWDLQSTGAMGTNFFTYPLMVACTVSGQLIKIVAQYDPKVMAPWLVERILAQFEHILHQLTSSALQKCKVGDVPVLNDSDRQQINTWNDKPLQTVYKTIHESIFSHKLGSTLALESWDGRFTFSQLDNMTSKMAKWLLYSGVKPGDLVPLCFERGALYVVVLLGVLKSGAAFVPLDPEAPESRLRDLIRGVSANLMLCSPHQEPICKALGVEVLVPDMDMTKNSSISSTKLPPVSPEQPAYCIYTSGSTGMPKGTVIQHSAFVSNAIPCAKMLHIEPGCRVLQFASYVFDSSLIEMLTPLIQGSSVFVPAGEDRLTNLMSYMQRNKIDWACLTPTVCQTMSPPSVPHLKTLVLAGEAMSAQHVSTWALHVRLINGYGPTETSVAATINNKMTETSSPSNIGYAVGGRCWIVDRNNHDRLQPLGAVGEILVEGPTLAHGYLNNPDKTAEVFITSPDWAREAQFQSDPYPRRFYKTGDLGKYNEDGSFFFIGRKDAQVKVRGQRLELGEVEQNLSLDSMIKHVITAIPASGPCAKRLIAAISMNSASGNQKDNSLLVDFGQSKIVSEIRDRLCQRLSSYMVPSLWVVFHSLPMLPSGKLDRRRVVKFVETMDDETYRRILNAEEEETHDLDISEVERQFQIIFGEVLNLPENKIGKTKSFLHLGGDSMSAMQVQARCKSAGLSVTVQDIIRAKSLEELASKVSFVQETAPQDEPIETTFTLSPIQKFFFDRVGDNFVRFNQSGPVLRTSRHFSHDDIARAATSITKTHSMLRARFDRMSDTTWSQRITNDVSGSYRFRSHRIQHSSQVASLAEESHASLNIETGPLWSIDAFDVLSDNSQLLFLVAHHLVIDVISWRIVLEDLESVLSGRSQVPQSLPFQIWSGQQEEKALNDFSTTVYPFKSCPKANLEYWGLSRSANLNGHVVSKTFELEPTYSLLLLGASDVLNTEALDIFIGSVLESFGRAFKDRTIPPVFNEGHGREPLSANQDLSRTIGWFTTLFPIHVVPDVGEETDILSTIRWVKDFRSRVPWSGRPYFAYSMLREVTNNPFTSHFPMEIAFNYLGKMQQHDREDALFRPIPDILTGQDVSGNVPRFSIFEISASISSGRVQFNFSYPKDIEHETNIGAWIRECKLCLHQAVDGLIKCKPDAEVTTFPLLPLVYRGDEKFNRRLLQMGIPSADGLEDAFPSSPMQQGILLSQIRNPEHYIFRTIFEVQPAPGESKVDISSLQSAWSAVVARHQALRMFFIESTAEQGLMEQCVLRDHHPRTSTFKCPDSRIPEIFQEHQHLNGRDHVPPHALAIAETTSSRVFCMLEMSHAISDGSSMGVLLDDLAAAYDGKLTEKEPAAQFSDYIKYFYSAERETDLAYWKNYLKDASPCLFPVLTEGVEGLNSQKCLEITFDHLTKINQFSRENAVTVASLLQLAWAILLRSYVGSDQITFGYVTSGRDIPLQGISQAVGCFVRMMICKVDFDDTMSVLAGLERVQNDFITAMDHQRCSLADVQHEIQQQSLFNTAFTLQRQSEQHDSVEGLGFRILDAMDPNEYAITLNADVSNTKIGVSMTYATNIVCEAQAANISEAYQQIVYSIVSSVSGQKLCDVEQLGESGLSQIATWNMKLPERVDQCIHQVIAEQVHLRPSAQAVCAWDAEYSFLELDSLSTNLAWMLQSLGIGLETPVPICFDKSAFVVVAMLGILKAGGTFVPIDGSHPESRLQMLITELGARHVLCSSAYQEKLLSVAGDAIVVNEQMLKRLPTITRPPIIGVGPSNLAYMIYTSGTTGVPKGTMIEHGSFCTSVKHHGPPLGICPRARVLQFANYTFDACVMEIISTLMLGGCVCVPSPEQRLNDLSGAIRSMRVNWAVLTPSVANTIQPHDVPDLKTLVTAGEAQTPALVSTWAKHCRLINAYGPSETSIIATFSVKSNEKGQVLNSDCATIGNAVGGRNWLVSSKNNNKLAPIGGIGELVVEGRVVSRGYINNKDKTATSFFQSPAWMNRKILQPLKAQSDRMYRTGDLCRYNPDGSLVYIGRKDTQVKLNGQRIEVGEVEHHVESKLPADILSAVDIVSILGSSGKALCVFLSATATTTVSSNNSTPNDSKLLLPFSESHRSMVKTLETELALVLPSYMIPTIFIPILRLPWNASGKLDRILLKSLVGGLSESELAPYRLADPSHKRLPTGRTEQALQRAWSFVLGRPPSTIGADDSWFRLGGDSVSSMRLVAAARHEGLIISVANVMTNPTLSNMALTAQSLDTQPSLTQLEPFSLLKSDEPIEQILQECLYSFGVDEQNIQDAYPASPLQQAFITLSEKQPGAYVAQNVFRLAPSVNVLKFKRAWQQVINDLSILRTRIVQTETGRFIQVVLKPQEIEWIASESVESLSDHALEIPSHNGGPLAAYAIVQEPVSGDRFFVWTIHHSTYDGWSMPLILNRVEQIYSRGKSQLPALPFSLFIEYLAKTRPDQSRDFWKLRLAGVEPEHFPSPPRIDEKPNFLEIHHSFPFNVPVGSNITPAALIRAAWALLLSAYSHSEDIIFGETLSGRDIPVEDITDFVGPILTTIPMRVKIDGDQSISDFLLSIVQNTLRAMEHQHYGLAQIKRIDEYCSAACEFQNLLVIQTEEDQEQSKLWTPHITDGSSSTFFTYPLVLECTAGSSTVSAVAHYNANVIPSFQIQRMLWQLETILGQLSDANAAETRLKDLNTISKRDFETVVEWNATEPLLIENTLNSVFQRQVSQRPNAIAISAHDGEFTYAELNNQASTVADYLSRLGVGPGVYVPVCLEKSKWMMVAILGVVLAGGAYVPLDPKHPISRHHEIIEDVHASVVLCSTQYRNLYTELPRITFFEVGENKASNLPWLYRSSTGTRTSNPAPNDPLYVIYTSGSTGRPKGVVIEHRSFCSSASAMCQAFRISNRTRAFHFASLVFDASVMETLTPLSCGATICIPSDADKLNDVSHTMNNFEVTWAFLTSSVANIITSPASVPTLETLVVGGEAMTAETVAKWTSGKVCLINAYGPTEATVSCNGNIDVANKRDPLNIGHAFASCRVWIVDPKDPNKLSPIGASGELAVEGPILARGYLNDSEKTKAAFFCNPTWLARMTEAKPEEQRVYLTGDLVRYSQDGSVVYIGRKDNQVKVNGQRLEIGEIEAHLVNSCNAHDAMVLFPKHGMCKKRLVAIISSATAQQVTDLWPTASCEMVSGRASLDLDPILSGARKALSAKLPPYMVPSVWISLKAIPRMLSGKLDRKKVLGWAEQMSKETYRTAMGIENRTSTRDLVSGTALVLRHILSRVLNISEESIDISQSFTSLGGDSITAMAMMARCRKEKITLNMHQILHCKSIEELSQSIGMVTEVSKTETTENHEPFALSPIQQLYFHLNPEQVDQGHFNQSFTLKFARKIDVKTVEEAIKKIVSQHPMLRARFMKVSNLWHQWTEKSVDSTFHFQVHNVGYLSDIANAISRSHANLNISRGPVFSVELFNVADDTQIIFLVAHHLVVDMVSWRIILQDLEEWIQVGSLLSEKSLLFSAWRELQSDRTTVSRVFPPSQITPPDLEFWGMVGKSNVYADTEFDHFFVSQTISSYALDGQTALKTEPVDLFIAATLHSFSRTFVTRKTPIVYNESHGREPLIDADPSRTVGWFTSLCPISVPTLEEQNGVIETLKRVKDARRKMSDNGRDYFASQLLGESSNFEKDFPVEIVFNYLGKMQQLERNESFLQPLEFDDPKDQTKVSDVGPNATRIALFEISATVTNGLIHFSFVYNRHMQRQEGIRQWIVEFERTFEELASSLRKLSRPEATLADFPLLPLESYDRLGKLTQKTLPAAGIFSLDNIEDIYPCVPMQEGMLLAQARDRKAYIFHVLFEMKFQRDGQMIPVDPQKLAKAWQKVTDKHPALRTIFINSICRGGVFDQVVLKQLSCTTKIIRKAHFDSSVLLECGMPSIKPAPPHQLTILSTQDERVFLKLEMNHAIIDGASHSILLQHLAEAYEDQLPNGSGPLYSNYVRYIRTEANKDGTAYWMRYLAGIRPCCISALKKDQNSTKRQGTLLVDFDQYPKLLDICKADKTTLSSMLQGIWARVLALYTNSDDVAFGYVASGRDVPVEGIQDAVGAFINMLVCRVKFKPGVDMRKVFQKVQSDFIDALPHQHTSLARVQHDLGLSGESLFNTAVSIQNHSEEGKAERVGLLFEQIEGYDPSEFALTVNIETAPNCEGVLLRYWTDIVSDANAARLGGMMAQIMTETLDLGAATHLSNEKREEPVTSSQPLLSQLERLVAMSSTQQGSSMDLSNMIQSIVDRVVQDAVKTALQSQPTLAGTKTTIVEDQVLETTAISSTRQGNMRDARTKVVNGYTHAYMSDARSELAEIVKPATDIPDLEPALDGSGALVDSVRRKLLSLWSEALDLSEDSIEPNDSFIKLGGDSIVAMKLVGAAREEGLTLTVGDVFQNPVFSDMARVCAAAEYDDTHLVKNIIGEDISAAVVPGSATPATSVTTLTGERAVLSPVSRFTAKLSEIQRQSQVSSLESGEDDWKQDWPAPLKESSVEVKTQIRNDVLLARRQTIREDIYRAFSLLKKMDSQKSVESFLQETIVPKVQVFRGGIADVLPTTDFQSLAITGALLESRWMLNYFYLDGEGDIDLRSLRKSAFRIVQAFDILRTVFVPYGDQFLQVVLRKLQPEFIVQETYKDLDDFTTQLHQRDRLYGPRLGESFVQFRVAKKTGTKRHRIFIRISHAQYDGVCMPMILEALHEGYQGQPIPSTPSFSNYVRDAAGRVTNDHYDYWRDLLQGSKMTEIVKHRKPNFDTSDREAITLRNTIYVDVNCFADSNVTAASFIKVAWAFVLAKITATSDIVFGHVISGRNSNVRGISSIVGPCLNTVPVRVTFQPQWTVLDLCRFVQSQQIDNMPYETLGSREIVKHCTEWPDWTNFSTVVQHQNVKIDEKVKLGDNLYKVGAIGSQLDTADMAILSTPKRDGSLELRLSFSSNSAISPEFAESVLQMLCQTLFLFSGNLHYKLPTPSEFSVMADWTLDSPVRRIKEDKDLAMNAELHGLDRGQVLALSDMLRSAWQRVLRNDKRQPVLPELHSSFFELGGDVIGLAQVASLLDQEGIKVRVEDLIEHHVMIDQLALIGLRVAEEAQEKLSVEAEKTLWPQQPPELPRRISLPRLIKSMTFGRKPGKKDT